MSRASLGRKRGGEMSLSEDFAVEAGFNRRIVGVLLRMARRLREKAEAYEGESDRLRAAAARDLAEYLEGVAADLRGR